MDDVPQVKLTVNPNSPNSQNPNIGELSVPLNKPENVDKITVTIKFTDGSPPKTVEYTKEEIPSTTNLLDKFTDVEKPVDNVDVVEVLIDKPTGA